MKQRTDRRESWRIVAGRGALAAVLALASASEGIAESYILPSSAFSTGARGAEFRTDVRVLNAGISPVTVFATFYDQSSGATYSANSFKVAGRSQMAFENVLLSLFSRGQGSFGPIRFEASGQLTVSASVNNVNACGTGAVSGQWLPGIDASQAMRAGIMGHLEISSNSLTGYRTNLVFMNPGQASATVSASLRQGDGPLIGSINLPALAANGFAQLALSSFPNASGRSDTNLFVEFTSTQPVLAFASVINNASGDPFAIVAAPDPVGSGAREEITVALPTGNVTFTLVKVPAGTFMMGSPTTERGRESNETLHQVTLTKDYYIGKYLVTQNQWAALMYSYGGGFTGLNDPVYGVSWNDVAGRDGFLERLNLYLSTQAGGTFRLATEAEWERAKRAGSQTRFSFGDALECDDACSPCPTADAFMWWCANAGDRGGTLHPVGKKEPNAYGLFDMGDDLTEWCQDWYGDYSSSPQTNPTGPPQTPSSTERVYRGGHWNSRLQDHRSAVRGRLAPAFRGQGFRIALSR